MRIALDMMGGDYAPEQACLGVLSFLETTQDCTLVLLGDETQIRAGLGETANKVKIIPTTEIIDMNEHPVRAMKEKPNSSLVVGFGLLARGDVDAFISAGNTGVMLVGASHVVKLAEGILRPTIPSPVPQISGAESVLVDVGINADCKPENLNQFATLATVYAREIQGKENPTVALLNIGEEEGKGNILAQATYPLLKENTNINFIGNVEGRDLINDSADIIICEGFTGNVVLKFAESLYDVIQVQQKLSDPFLERFNHKLYGGVPVLGCNKPVVVGHGVSDKVSFTGMLHLARKMILSKVCEKIAANII
ncbi:MAG: phosphate acyltransferase PlsX [Chitinophagaceae bacterium]|nr:phosphate acyltransferase PlsX [Chitinophagaceae bacterium]